MAKTSRMARNLFMEEQETEEVDDIQFNQRSTRVGLARYPVDLIDGLDQHLMDGIMI